MSKWMRDSQNHLVNVDQFDVIEVNSSGAAYVVEAYGYGKEHTLKKFKDRISAYQYLNNLGEFLEEWDDCCQDN